MKPHYQLRSRVFFSIIAAFVILSVVMIGYQIIQNRSQADTDLGRQGANKDLLRHEFPY